MSLKPSRAKARGLLFSTDRDGRVHEDGETFTCGHCNSVTMVPPMARPEDIGGLCYGCMRAICSRCVDGGCDPIEEKLQRIEASYHARRSYGL